MSQVNRGKAFENQISEGLKKVPNTVVTRLYDSTNGYKGVCTICDFVVYKCPNSYYLECKSVYGNRLSFNNITRNQWKSLLNVSGFRGVYAGIICWWIDYDKTYYMPIETLAKLKYNSNIKSIDVNQIEKYHLSEIEITGEKKRIFFNYDMQKFFDIIENT